MTGLLRAGHAETIAFALVFGAERALATFSDWVFLRNGHGALGGWGLNGAVWVRVWRRKGMQPMLRESGMVGNQVDSQ